MSLGIVIKGSEGIVLAAESRVTLGGKVGDKDIPVFFDNATKLLSFMPPNTTVGAVTYGQAVMGVQTPRTAASFLPEFEDSLPDTQLTVKEFAVTLSTFFQKQWEKEMPDDWKGSNMTFVVGGFDEVKPYGEVHLIEIPRTPTPVQHHEGAFGITFGGQREIMDRVLVGYDSSLPKQLAQALNIQGDQLQAMNEIMGKLQSAIPLQVFALQDCVDLAIFFIKTTMGVQRFTIGLRGVGGAIDVAVITRNKALKFVQQKIVHGEIE